MRLIDADKLIETVDNFVNENEWLLNQFNADYIESLVEEQPTAYDVDKVVEQICGCDGCSGCCNCHEEERMMECEEYARVYEIVKKGGVE